VNCSGNGRFRATITPPSDLTISKSHEGDFAVGSEEFYTLTVTNLGPARTNGEIRVTDTLPAGLRFRSGLGNNWVCSASGQTVTCTSQSPLEPDESSSIILAVDVDKEAVPNVTNTACVSYENDINTANDCASDYTKVNDSTVIVTRAITKSHNGDFTVGSNDVYFITIFNNGLLGTTGEIKVTDFLPPGLRFISGSGPGWTCSATGQTVTCTNPGPLAPGQSSDIALAIDVINPGVTILTNTAHVWNPGDYHDPNNSASDLTIINCSSSISPAEQSFEAEGGISAVDVTTEANCEVSVTKDVNWIQIISVASIVGTNNSRVTYRVEENTGASSRVGTLTIAGRPFTVTQAGHNHQPVLPAAVIEINPADPTESDDITITISGEWPNGCIPQNPQVSFSSGQIGISTYNSGQFCTQAITPWRHAIQLGKLPPGSFLITINHSTSAGTTKELGRKTFTVRNTQILLEGEAGNSPGPVMTRSNALNHKTVWLHAGESLKLIFQLPVTACYELDVRYSNDNFGPLEDVEVSVDGIILGRFTAQDTGDFGAGWNNFMWSNLIGVLNLQPGPHEIILTVTGGDGYGVEIDAVKFSVASCPTGIAVLSMPPDIGTANKG
jgi:uncharacterized repeat protein (TIGR01451 family)